jgi:hypothetical protein
MSTWCISGSPLQDSHYVMSSFGIDLIYHEELLIPPVARNLAAAQANGDYFLFPRRSRSPRPQH